MITIRRFSLFFLIFTSVFPVFGQTVSGERADWEVSEVIHRLLSVQEPNAPIVQGNSIIFTADSSHRRVGVAFAHEHFKEIYWFKKLLIPQDRLNPVILPGQKVPDPFKDSGIQFFVFDIPEHLNEIEYRLIINGLWTTDPLNTNIRRDPVSGLNLSLINLPQRPKNLNPIKGMPDGLLFTFHAPPGEIITVAGSFNSWDPFMFELKEGPAGTYSLLLPLPPGTYHYAFYYKGQRVVDPNNPKRAYARDGTAVSEITVP